MPNGNAAKGKKMSQIKKIQASGKPVVRSAEEIMQSNQPSDAKTPTCGSRGAATYRDHCVRGSITAPTQQGNQQEKC